VVGLSSSHQVGAGQVIVGENHSSTVTSNTIQISAPNWNNQNVQLAPDLKPHSRLTFSPGLMFNYSNPIKFASNYTDDDEDTLFYDASSMLNDSVYESMNVAKVSKEQFFDAVEYLS
jgi:hypothetical protein